MEEKDEAKETVEQSQDEKMDEIYDKKQETQAESSPAEEPQEEPKATEEPGAEPAKPETEEAKEEIPKEFHKHPAWQRILKERDEAKGKNEELTNGMEDFNKTTSSAAYIESSMKAKGYTQEAIDSTLREKGFNVPERPGDDFALVTGKLGIDPKSIDENARATITDFTKIARVIMEDTIGKTLPNQLAPLKEGLDSLTNTHTADRILEDMKGQIDKEGVLDFGKDVEPALQKFLTENPEAKQKDVLNHFKEISRELSFERLKTGKRKEARDEKKGNLRQNTKSTTQTGKVPTMKKGEDINEYMDTVLDSFNFRE